MTNTGAKKVKELTDTENKMEKVQEKASGKLFNAAGVVHNKTDEAQEFLAEKLANTEDVLRKKTYEVSDYTQQNLEQANKLGHRAADLIENSSEYIKDFDARETKEKLVKTIKNNPEIGIAIAGVFGLLVGYLAGRKSK